jgi:outer membrane protein
VALGQGFQATAELRQLIFDFNHTRDLVRQSVAFERAAFQNLTAVQANIVNQVKQAYYVYVQDERLVAENQSNLDNRNSQLALARARLNSGLGLPSDVVTAETAVAQAVIGLNTAQNNATFQRISLTQLMGIDPRTPITTTDASEPTLPTDDVNGLVTTALQRRPEVLEAQANIDANRYGLNAARTTNAPVISGNVQYLSKGDQFLPGNDSVSIGAAIQFSPFDGGLTAGKVRQARAELESARASLVLTQQQVIADVTQAYTNLRSAEQRVTEANSEVQNAEEGVRIATGRYREGLGLFLDIINAQAFLLTARTDLVNARAAVDTARAAVQRAIGTPLPTVTPAR